MKSLWFILFAGFSLFIALAVSTGCEDELSYTDHDNYYIYTFDYSGHDYLSFRNKSHNGKSGVVHDPDCKHNDCVNQRIAHNLYK